MTVSTSARKNLVGLLLLALLVLLAGWRAAAETPASVAELIGAQEKLDQAGTLELPPGDIVLREPLTVGPHQTLRGAGNATRLLWKGGGDEALWLGKPGGDVYGARIEQLALVGGTLRVAVLDGKATIESVWITQAKTGLLIEGVGERLRVVNVTAYGNIGDGVQVLSHGVCNGVTFERLTSQHNGGVGLRMETLDADATLNHVLLRDSEIQGNRGVAQVLIRGWVGMARLENVWIESGSDKDRPMGAGLIAEARLLLDERKGVYVRRVPNRLTLTGGSVVSACAPGLRLIGADRVRLDDVLIQPPATIEWSGTAGPGGTLRDVSTLQIKPTTDR